MAEKINEIAMVNNGSLNGDDVNDKVIGIYFSFRTKDDIKNFKQQVEKIFDKERVNVEVVGTPDPAMMGVN